MHKLLELKNSQVYHKAFIEFSKALLLVSICLYLLSIIKFMERANSTGKNVTQKKIKYESVLKGVALTGINIPFPIGPCEKTNI